ncbi:MAG: NAD(P)-binding protein, partial [Bdellovibrionota bacterium]
MSDPRINRRQAISLLGGGAIGAFWFSGAWAVEHLSKTSGNPTQTKLEAADFSFNPIDRTLGSTLATDFTGDHPSKNHIILWDKPKFLASLSNRSIASTEVAPLVIVGGGMSGILTAYALRKYNPILLEQAPRMGGNSRGESWRGIDYSIGAAYFTKPDSGSFIDQLIQEIGLTNEIQIRQNHDPVLFQGRMLSHFWNGASDPEHSSQFVILKKYFEDLVAEKSGLSIPQIPFSPKNPSPETLRLSKITFKEHLETLLSGPLHPHLNALIERYCWSSFAASSGEIHAAAGINFFASEFQSLCFVPGGNSRIAELTLSKLMSQIPHSHFRPESMVYDVRADLSGARVSYVDAKGVSKVISTDCVVLACPKFIAAKLLHEIEPERAKAIKTLEYHSYLVANVWVNHSSKFSFFVLYSLEKPDSNEKSLI